MADNENITKTIENVPSSPDNANNNTQSLDSPSDDRKVLSNNNWWGSWINSAKSKSASVLEAVKRDLDEITTAVRTEVTHAGSMIGETLKLDEPESTASTMKKSLSSFFGQVSEALAPTIEDDDTEAVLITSDGVITLTGFQKHLADLQANDTTYLTPPDSTLNDNYRRWLEIIDQDQFTQNQLAKQLASSEILNEKYLTLVPEQVSHMEFWKRYLFKRALLEDALAHAELAERRAKAEIQSTQTVSPKQPGEIVQTEQPKCLLDDTEEVETATAATSELVIEDTDLKWGSEDFGNEEIPEEVQARLLEQYDAELQEKREKRKSLVGADEKVASKPDQPKSPTAKAQSQTSQQQKSTSAGKKAVKPTNISSKQTDNAKVKSNTKTKANAGKGAIKKPIADTPETSVKCLAEDLKTDAGAASDESWEKDFDLSDP